MTQVLVVDDSAVDRRLVGGLLEKNSSLSVSFAADGEQALESMERTLPVLVVTDMQMPRVNGLELVEAIRARYPSVPVVLITAQGSEEIAVAALERGAASYVPKSALARALVPTVMNVLTQSRADHNYERMMSCLRECQWSFELENDYTLIAPLVNLLRHAVSGLKLCDDTGRVQVGVALEEALSNALYHGNLELTDKDLAELGYDLDMVDSPNLVERRRRELPYRDRKVRIVARLTRDEARFEIEDDGPGFDYESVSSPEDALVAEDVAGRGITHMRLFMDEVVFNNKGNKVVMVRRRK